MYHETILDNGIIVASEYVNSVETTSVGVFIRAGARNETTQNNGVAHYLEHMAFKGTQKRSAKDIAREVEDVGSFMNAYTSRETTAYYIKSIHNYLPLSIDILGDILCNSIFSAEEMEKERNVILQEIAMTKDTPDDLVFENLQTVLYPNQSMGRSILGSNSTVENITCDDLQKFMTKNYHGKRIVVAATGKVDHGELSSLVSKHFTAIKAGKKVEFIPPTYGGGVKKDLKPLEQAQIAINWNGVYTAHFDYYPLQLWAGIVGGGMASRLFQEVREKRGLAYNIYAYNSSLSDNGTFGIYAACAPQKQDELLKIVLEELQKATGNITTDELLRAKNQMKASIVMGLESTDTRMSYIASDLFIHGRFRTVDEVLKQIDSVTINDAQVAANNMLNGSKESLSILSPK